MKWPQQCTKHILVVKGETDKSIATVGDFNTPLLHVDRSMGEKTIGDRNNTGYTQTYSCNNQRTYVLLKYSWNVYKNQLCSKP